jgi:hypothetical protein
MEILGFQFCCTRALWGTEHVTNSIVLWSFCKVLPLQCFAELLIREIHKVPKCKRLEMMKPEPGHGVIVATDDGAIIATNGAICCNNNWDKVFFGKKTTGFVLRIVWNLSINQILTNTRAARALHFEAQLMGTDSRSLLACCHGHRVVQKKLRILHSELKTAKTCWVRVHTNMLFLCKKKSVSTKNWVEVSDKRSTNMCSEYPQQLRTEKSWFGTSLQEICVLYYSGVD